MSAGGIREIHGEPAKGASLGQLEIEWKKAMKEFSEGNVMHSLLKCLIGLQPGWTSVWRVLQKPKPALPHGSCTPCQRTQYIY